jgi:hypothetical protein
MFSENLQSWFLGLAAQYNVDPFVFGAIYVGSTPLFWLAAAWIVRNFRAGKSVMLPSFCAAVCSLSSYIYLIFAGRNIPVWIYWAIVLLISLGTYSTVKNIRRRSLNTNS